MKSRWTNGLFVAVLGVGLRAAGTLVRGGSWARHSYEPPVVVGAGYCPTPPPRPPPAAPPPPRPGAASRRPRQAPQRPAAGQSADADRAVGSRPTDAAAAPGRGGGNGGRGAGSGRSNGLLDGHARAWRRQQPVQPL